LLKLFRAVDALGAGERLAPHRAAGLPRLQDALDPATPIAPASKNDGWRLDTAGTAAAEPCA
jgi:hypothetical protein